jgi:hypothetical protein
MTEPNIIVGFVDFGRSRELLDHLTHDLEAVSVASGLVVAGSGVEKGVSPESVVGIGLLGSGFVVSPGLVKLPEFGEEVVGQTNVRFEAYWASRIALYDGSPDFEGLLIFTYFKAGITGLQELACGTILDDRAPFGCSRLLGNRDRDQAGKEEGSEERKSCSGHGLLYEQFLDGLSIFP